MQFYWDEVYTLQCTHTLSLSRKPLIDFLPTEPCHSVLNSRGCSTNTSSNTDSLINSFFVEISSKHLHSQTVRARELKFWPKVHLPPPVSWHVSHIPYHMSHVTFSSSFVIWDKVVNVVGGGYVINEAY